MKYTIDKIPESNIDHSFDALKIYKKEIIIEFINNYFNEEEKIYILRNEEFINDIPNNLLTLMLNNMSLISVFNMLQNKTILSKVENLNLKLSGKDAIFLSDYLSNSNLIGKIDHNMLKNMLNYASKNDVIESLKEPFIIKKLTTNDIVNIAILKRIDLVNDINLINRLSKEEIIKYVNEFWKNGIDYSIVDNDYVKQTIFNIPNINLEEIIYLYDSLTTKSNHNLKDVNHSLESFKSVLALSELLGLQASLNLFNDRKYGLNDITYALKDVDISKIHNNAILKDFVLLNIKDILDNKYPNLILSFGNIINNFKDEYKDLDIYDIEEDILSNLNINRKISNKTWKKVINNAYDYDIKSRVNKTNKKFEKMSNTKQIININNDRFRTISNNDELMLTLDYEVAENSFIIEVDNKYIYGVIDNNNVYIDDEYYIDLETLDDIANELYNQTNGKSIIIESDRKDINGIRLSDNLIIIKSNKEIKNKSL